jgi:hypothetical protein
VERVEVAVEGARRSLGSAAVRTRAEADSLIQLASDNLDFVKLGKSAHNIGYADEILVSSVDLLKEAIEVGRLPYSVDHIDLGTRVRRNICLRCHLTAERLEVRFQGSVFDHEPHVYGADQACSDCHTPLEEHGGTTVTDRATCSECHHRSIEPMNCARCHAGPGGAPTETLSLAEGDFSHPVHHQAGVACAECHTPPTMSARGLDCAACHESHHRPEVNCLDCHRGGVVEDHNSAAHGGCARCHDEAAEGISSWSRQVCTVCHERLTDHNAPLACETCHRVPELKEND